MQSKINHRYYSKYCIYCESVVIITQIRDSFEEKKMEKKHRSIFVKRTFPLKMHFNSSIYRFHESRKCNKQNNKKSRNGIVSSVNINENAKKNDYKNK